MLKSKIAQYLSAGQVMQIATTSNDQPWVASVYFVPDDDLNLYWLSLPTRRHSQEIVANPKIAVALAIKQDLPVIGIQAEGTVQEITDVQAISEILTRYIDKYDEGHEFVRRFQRGSNKHHLYKFIPKRYLLLDEQNALDKGQQELMLN